MKLVAKFFSELSNCNGLNSSNLFGKRKKKKADFLFDSTSEKLGRYAFGGAVDCQLVKAIAHIALGD